MYFIVNCLTVLEQGQHLTEKKKNHIYKEQNNNPVFLAA